MCMAYALHLRLIEEDTKIHIFYDHWRRHSAVNPDITQLCAHAADGRFSDVISTSAIRVSQHPALVLALEWIQYANGTCIHYANSIGKDVLYVVK